MAGAGALKPALRARARAERRAFVQALGPGQRAALQEALAETLLRHVPPRGIWASHFATADEIDPSAATVRAADAGASICKPAFSGRDAPMEFRARCPAPHIGPFGVLQPSATQAVVRPEVVLVPLLAADPAGNRLGQGGGHYDRALAALRATGPVLAIGVCWPVQLWEHCPADPWDAPLDALALPGRWIEVRR